MSYLHFSAAFLALATVCTTAHAQDSFRRTAGDLNNPYSGAIFIAPQNSKFLAPGIYRSQESVDQIVNPLNVNRICTADFREIKALKKLEQSAEESEAPGIEGARLRDLTAGGGIDAKVVSLDVSGTYSDNVRVTATQIKVISGDDNIAKVVLSKIGRDCRDTIAGHLKLRRLVFVAQQAIQAKNYTVSVDTTLKGDAKVECKFFVWCKQITVGGKQTNEYKRSASNYVTFALVPAELEPGRQLVASADLSPSQAGKLASSNASLAIIQRRVSTARAD